MNQNSVKSAEINHIYKNADYKIEDKIQAETAIKLIQVSELAFDFTVIYKNSDHSYYWQINKDNYLVNNCSRHAQEIWTDSEEDEEFSRYKTSDTSNTKLSKHRVIHWCFCYEDSCLTHQKSKESAEWYSKQSRQKQANK